MMETACSPERLQPHTTTVSQIEMDTCPKLKMQVPLFNSLQREVTLRTRVRDILGLNLRIPALLT